MNLYKISKSMNRYIDSVKDVYTPDVYQLFRAFGKDVMGRNIYLKKRGQCFNKSVVHKKKDSYIGEWKKGFYAQDIVQIENEERFLCVKGSANGYQDIADKIIKHFGITDFVFDIYNKKYLMEVNEIHLSSIKKSELDYIITQIN